MSSPLRFTILHESAGSAARVGRVDTPHGSFDTPAFMPVGTKATIKGLTPDQILATGSQIILNNAYHLMLRPGDDLISQVAGAGGVHEFMRWNGPILTDSGGFQAFSMSDIARIDEDGVTFQSIIDGSIIHLSPERSIQVQNNLGADIIMAFDDCPPAQASMGSGSDEASESMPGQDKRVSATRLSAAEYRSRVIQANQRTTRWLHRCINAHARVHDQALFGIVQGGTDHELRAQSARDVCEFDLPGYAIGGVAVGEAPDQIHRVVKYTASLLPQHKPRYLMGVGYERDILAAVLSGVDMFDCVLPTRNGRNGNVFTRRGRLHLRNACFREDTSVIEAGCDCFACSGSKEGSVGKSLGGNVEGIGGGFSRSYLRHLFMADEMLGPILASIHNIRHFQRLMLDIRRAIREDGWPLLQHDWPVLEVLARDGKK